MDERERGTGGEAFAALVIAEAGDATEALRAIELAGGRECARVGWAAIEAGLARPGEHIVIVAEAGGVCAGMLTAGLSRIALAASLRDLHLIVALDEAQIDPVTAQLLGERVQLLCSPTLAERVAALVIAAEMTGRTALHDPLSEREAARLARLNEEVARIAEVLARLSRREEALPPGEVADRRPVFDSGPPADADPIDPQAIRQVIRSRRLRDRHFGNGLFEDPAWDMLLDLFAAHLERAEVSVSSLCIAAAVAPTTALRWIGRMTEAGLLVRQPDPFDRRRALMALSTTALERMRAYFAAVRAQGLPVA